GVSRRDRRGGPVCRSRPFRPGADPERLAGVRLSRPDAQLSGAGRPPAQRSEGAGESVLSALSGLGTTADGCPRDRRHRHRQPGGHPRALFADQAGHRARSVAAPGDQHTSEEHEGQIYMPRINSSLLVGVLLLVALFRSSSALASAYGIAVTGTMVVTA